MDFEWVREYPGAITVCDAKGFILFMNEMAGNAFQKSGGLQLIGANILDCHPEPARTKVKELLEYKTSNVYTIEKNGIWKIVSQLPWHHEGQFGGFVEWVIEIPETMPHFKRQA
jgi:hypothetical protein